MKKFHFNLSSIRELRQAQEQAAQKRYADSVRACEEAAARLVVLDRDLQNVWSGLRNNLLTGATVAELRHARAWCCALEEKQKVLAGELAVCQRDMDKRHRELQKASQRREAMERLFRRQRRAYEREMQVEDQKFLDEIATRGAWQSPRFEPQLEAA